METLPEAPQEKRIYDVCSIYDDTDNIFTTTLRCGDAGGGDVVGIN